ncbi:MAG: hypothetical protein EOO01_35450 [Chitinophagaceae bacterium]|nr:MAG: hypothetical protein EOO01_35450 [Chitinophagaceae bacterium]
MNITSRLKTSGTGYIQSLDSVRALAAIFVLLLHGSYGYCYSPDGDAVKKSDSYLEVKTASGNLRYRLAPSRLRSGVMNKFHINIPASVSPSDVAIVTGGKVMDRKPISRPTAKSAFTVNGAAPEKQ